MRLRLLAPTAALLALLLAAQPAAAGGPPPPPTGQWTQVGSTPYPPIIAGTVWGGKMGPDGKLYVYGSFQNAGGDDTADNLAVYSPATGAWSGIGSNGTGDGALGSIVYDVEWYNGQLYAAGGFAGAGGVPGADYLASWNGTTWVRRGGASALNAAVMNLSVAGGYLYLGGAFTNAGGDPTADSIASFDGYSFHGLASSGAVDGDFTATVYALDTLPDGRVFVGGTFADVGPGGKCDAVCWWDPASESWNPVGDSAAHDNAIAGVVLTLSVLGSKIYIGGSFNNADGDALADNVALWTGSAWTHLGSNGAGDGPINGPVYGMMRYGSNIIVGGIFVNGGGVAAADMIAAWNGTKWLALGTPAFDSIVLGGAVSGRVFYATGAFTQAALMLPHTAGIAQFGLPGLATAPRSPSGTSGTKKVTLKWTAPATTNGSGPVRDYIVQWRKGSTGAWHTFTDGVKSTTGAVVTGLASGTTYQFHVAAKTDWGIGAYSAIVTKKAN